MKAAAIGFLSVVMLMAGFQSKAKAADCRQWEVPQAGSGIWASSCDGKITELYTHSNGNVYIKLEGDYTGIACTLTAGGYLKLTESTKLFREMYSSILAAFVSGKRIRLRMAEKTDNNPVACDVWYVIVYQ